jgi:hypothetical protein
MPSQKNNTYPTPDQPRQVRLDSTTFCNAKCVSCHGLISDRKGRMPEDLILSVLKDISKWPKPLEEIVPVNYGEFFTLPDWYKLLKLIETNLPRTKIVIPTNGSLLNKESIALLATVQTVNLLNFSINAYFDETYEAFTKLPAATMENIKLTINQIHVERPDIMVRVSMVFDPSYQSDFERDMFIQTWRTIAEPWILPAASCGRGTALLIPRITPCRSLFSDFVVGFDGKLSSCCFDAGMILDAGEYSGDLLKDWKNPKLEEIRRIHNSYCRSDIDLCNHCTYA